MGKSETIQENEPCSNKQMRSYRGMIDLSCITLKEPKTLKENIEKTLAMHKIHYNTKGMYTIICDKNEVRFVIEIMKLKSTLNYLKLQRTKGAMKEYKAIVTKLLNHA